MKTAFIAIILILISVAGAICAEPTKQPGAIQPSSGNSKSPPTSGVINKDIIVERLAEPAGSDGAGTIAFSSDAILFGYGSAKIRPESHEQLTELAEALKDPALDFIPFFYVDGHTCDIGTEARNCNLSVARAESVVAFLTDKGGVPAERLKPRGFGEQSPAVENSSDVNRRKNRRVVIKSSLIEVRKPTIGQCGKNE